MITTVGPGVNKKHMVHMLLASSVYLISNVKICAGEIKEEKSVIKMICRPTKQPLSKEEEQQKILKAKEKRERKRLKREKLNG